MHAQASVFTPCAAYRVPYGCQGPLRTPGTLGPCNVASQALGMQASAAVLIGQPIRHLYLQFACTEHGPCIDAMGRAVTNQKRVQTQLRLWGLSNA